LLVWLKRGKGETGSNNRLDIKCLT
jgi:hypothetical protein